MSTDAHAHGQGTDPAAGAPRGPLTGRCHCGAVAVTVPSVPATMTMCNCSLCRRYGVLWAYYALADVAVDGHPQHTETYSWGPRELHFVRCRHCGCVMQWAPITPEADDRCGVNLRNFEPALLRDVRLRWLDGADTWAYLDEPDGDAQR